MPSTATKYEFSEERWQAIFDFADAVERAILGNSPETFAEIVTQHASVVFEVADVLYWELAPDEDGKLLLKTVFGELGGYSRTELESALLPIAREALTTRYPRTGRVKPTGARTADGDVDELKYLSMRFANKKGRPLGALMLLSTYADDHEAFPTRETIALARTVSRKVSFAIDVMQTSSTLRRLVGGIIEEADLRVILAEILRTALALLNGSRGEIAWHDEKTGKLVQVASVGKSAIENGQPIPANSACQQVWRTNELLNIPNVRQTDASYFECDPATTSEVAVPLGTSERAVGVLNVESSAINFFTEYDVRTLRHLGNYATLAMNRAASRFDIDNLVEMATTTLVPTASVLRQVLETVEREFHIDAGIVYIADHINRQLVCAQTLGCEHADIVPNDVVFRFEETSFASLVLKSAVVEISPKPQEDDRVNQRAFKRLDARGPLLGLPLMLGREIVGVLVLWSRDGELARASQDAPRLRELASELRRFTHRAAAAIALTTQGRIRDLRDALRAIQSFGFRRVRVFQYRAEEQAFVGVDAVGMANIPQFCGMRIRIVDNPYAADILEKQRPRVYPDDADFGTDPDHEQLGKHRSQSWAVFPLRVNNRFFGYLAVDNGSDSKQPSASDLPRLRTQAQLCESYFSQVDINNLATEWNPAPLLSEQAEPTLENSDRAFDTFVCYSRDDSQFALELIRDLKREGIRPWFDTDDLMPGNEWKSGVKEAIRKSKCAIVLIGNEVGRYQSREIEMIVDLRSRRVDFVIIPVFLRTAPSSQALPSALHDLRHFHRADFRNAKYHQTFEKLLTALSDLKKAQADRSTKVARGRSGT